MGWDKDSLRSKAKATHTSEEKQEIHSLLRIDWQVFSHLQESRNPSCVMATWEDKCHHSECPLLPSSFPRFICWVRCHKVWNTPLVSWGQLSQLCPLPTSCASPAYSLVVRCEKKKKTLMLCKQCSAIMKTSLYYQQYFQHKSKTQPMLTTMKKTNSTAAKPSTAMNCFVTCVNMSHPDRNTSRYLPLHYQNSLWLLLMFYPPSQKVLKCYILF